MLPAVVALATPLPARPPPLPRDLLHGLGIPLPVTHVHTDTTDLRLTPRGVTGQSLDPHQRPTVLTHDTPPSPLPPAREPGTSPRWRPISRTGPSSSSGSSRTGHIGNLRYRGRVRTSRDPVVGGDGGRSRVGGTHLAAARPRTETRTLLGRAAARQRPPPHLGRPRTRLGRDRPGRHHAPAPPPGGICAPHGRHHTPGPRRHHRPLSSIHNRDRRRPNPRRNQPRTTPVGVLGAGTRRNPTAHSPPGSSRD